MSYQDKYLKYKKKYIQLKKQLGGILDLSDSVENFDYLLGRSWYIRNPELQALLKRVVDLGYGKEVNTLSGDFKNHLLDILTSHSVAVLPSTSVAVPPSASVAVPSSASVAVPPLTSSGILDLSDSVENFDYLLGRSWYIRNPELQALLKRVVDLGYGKEVNVIAKDFKNHLLDILTSRGVAVEGLSVTPLKVLDLSSSVAEFDYLQEKVEYMRNPELQTLLKRVVDLGYGKEVNVIAGDFKNHLLDILKNHGVAVA